MTYKQDIPSLKKEHLVIDHPSCYKKKESPYRKTSKQRGQRRCGFLFLTRRGGVLIGNVRVKYQSTERSLTILVNKSHKRVFTHLKIKGWNCEVRFIDQTRLRKSDLTVMLSGKEVED